MSVLRMGELFAGYGGLGMGVTDVLDVELAWVSEFDKGANKILAHRFPDVPNHGDITKIDWTQVEPVDVLTGGSPCQDLSHAGKRAGMTEGTRSNLWVAMREAIAALRPSLVIWENVRGAYSAEAASGLVDDARLLADTRRRDGEPVLRALGRVLGDLSDLGYDASWHGLRAADVGAPHGRFRVFVVAYPQGDTRWLKHGDRGSAAADTSHGTGDGQRPCPQPRERGATAPDSDREGRGVLGREYAEQRDADGHRRADGPRASAERSALLPSPRTSDTNGAGRHGDGGLDLRTAVTMLPTPRATDGTKGGPNQRGSSGDLMLPSAVQHLLPTPVASEGEKAVAGQTAEHRIAGGHQPFLTNAIASLALLPTPAVNDMGASYTPDEWDAWTDRMKAEHGNGNGHGKSLHVEAARLLPTTSVADVTGGRKSRSGDRSGELLLNGIAAENQWGQYAAAIARWEQITRPAPAPTETGPKGNPRLSPAFSEWMMGLPAGWVTDVPDITRNEALKALGNGVVPQQAAAALRFLLAQEVAA